jgi:hypothetical protein
MNKRLIFLLITLIALIIVLIFSIVSFTGDEVKNKDLNLSTKNNTLVKDVVKAEEQTTTQYKYIEGDCLSGLNTQVANLSDTKYAFGELYFSQPDGYELKSINPLIFNNGLSQVSVSILKYDNLEDLIKDIANENEFESLQYLKIGTTYQICSEKGSTKYLYYLLLLKNTVAVISYTANKTDFEKDLQGYILIKDSLSFYE